MHKRSTDELLKQLEQGKDLAPYLEENKGEFEKIPLCYALAELLDRYGLRKAPFISASGLDKAYAYQIFDGKKTAPSRDKLLAICLAMGITLPETQRVLRLGHVGQLHPRNIRDSVIIHSILHHVSVQDTNDLLYDLGKEILD